MSQWVQVSERLPKVEAKFSDAEHIFEKDGGYVLSDVYTCYESDDVLIFGTTHEYGDPVTGMFVARYGEWIYESGEKIAEWRDTAMGDLSFTAEAWMPLPEPPHKEERS